MVETLSPSCGGRTGLDLLHYLKGEKASMGYSCLEMKSQNTSILPSLDGVNHRDRKETNKKIKLVVQIVLVGPLNR
jgi:hypothetical protein